MLTVRVKSENTPGKTYLVCDAGDRFFCSCPVGRRPVECKHAQAVRLMTELAFEAGKEATAATIDGIATDGGDAAALRAVREGYAHPWMTVGEQIPGEAGLGRAQALACFRKGCADAIAAALVDLEGEADDVSGADFDDVPSWDAEGGHVDA